MSEKTTDTPQVADKMPDGSYYIGRSPTNNQDMFITPAGIGFFMKHDEAVRQIGKLNKDKHLGHKDWVMPDIAELRVIWRNAEVGMLRKTFNFVAPTFPGNVPGAFYWSSTQEGPDNHEQFWHKRITDGFETYAYGWSERNMSSLRGIRYETVAYTPGDEMPDGSVYVGDSPRTGRQMFMMPAALGVATTFNGASAKLAAANDEKAMGHADWQIPTKAEWAVIEENKAKGLLDNVNLPKGVDDRDGWSWQAKRHGGTNRWAPHLARQDGYAYAHASYVNAIRLG